MDRKIKRIVFSIEILSIFHICCILTIKLNLLFPLYFYLSFFSLLFEMLQLKEEEKVCVGCNITHRWLHGVVRRKLEDG